MSRIVDTGEAPRRRDAQLAWEGRGVWRLRQCSACRQSFDTEEVVRLIKVRPATIYSRRPPERP